MEVELRKICTAPARESDLEVKIDQNSEKLLVSGRFWRFKVLFAWQAQGFWHVAKNVAGAGVREGYKNVGRRGGFGSETMRVVWQAQ